MQETKKLKVKYKGGISLREKVVLWLLETGAPLHDILNPGRIPWNLNSNDLYTYPDGSLGKCLSLFYKKEGFEPVSRAERHDVFHVLLGYSTTVADEAAMQFFLLGNGKWSLFSVGTAFISAFLFPSQWDSFYEAYRQGRKAVNFSKWDFRQLLHCNLDLLRNQIFKHTI